MGQDRDTGVWEQMAPLERQMAAWRRQATGASKMPEEFWLRAVEYAREHGTESVAQFLRLDHGILKRRLLASARAPSAATSPSGFVELCGVQLFSALPQERRSTIEFCRRDGARMLVHVSDEGAVDMLSLAAMFLEAST